MGHFRAHSAKDSTSTAKTGWWSKRSILWWSKGLLQEKLLRVSGLCCSCDQLKIQHSWVGSSLCSRTTSAGRSCFFETGYRTLQRRPEPWKTGTSAAFSQWHARNWEASSDSVIWLTCSLELTLQDIWKKWKHWWNCCLFYRLRYAVLRDHALLFVGWRLTLGQLCLYQDWTM